MDNKTILIALTVSIALSSPVGALQGVTDLKRNLADYTAVVEAERIKSSFCGSYVGRTIKVQNFDILSQQIGGATNKGEFETSAQSQARQAVALARMPKAPVVLAVAAHRDFVRYEADLGAFFVSAGAFGIGRFSEEPQPEIAASLARPREPEGAGPTFELGVGQSERLISSSVRQTAFGVSLRVAEKERHTKGIVAAGSRLFDFAPVYETAVAIIEAAPSQAARIKQGLTFAVVLEPTAPYVIKGSMKGSAATAREPVHYTELVTLLVGTLRCAVIMDGQSKVLASIDAGTPKAAAGGK